MRGGPRGAWTVTAVLLLEVVVLAVLAVVGNAWVNALPAGLSWLEDWRLLGGVFVSVLLVTLVVVWLRVRSEPAGPPDEESGRATVTHSPGAVQTQGSPGAITATDQGRVYVNSTVYEGAPPLPEPKPGQVVVGDIPHEPVAFQHRPELVGELAAALTAERVAVVCALAGGRGVGKTQLAAALARQRVAEGCPLVAWVSGDDPGRYVSGLATVAERLGVADPDGDTVKSAHRLRDHLGARTEPGLLVVDNATHPDAVARFLPATGAVQVLVTTTDHAFANLGREVPVDVYRRPESLDYLRRHTGRADPDADRLADALGDLPLALTQAAAVIVGKGWTYRRYLEELDRVPVDRLLTRQEGQPYPKGAAEAILLALDAAENGSPAVTEVLNVLALLSPDGVPRHLILGLARNDPDPSRIEDAVERCVRASLVTVAGEGELLLHRLVARVLRDKATAGRDLDEAVDAALDLLDAALIPEEAAWRRREEGRDLVTQITALWTAGRSVWSPVQPVDERTSRILGLRRWTVYHLTLIVDLSRARPLGTETLADCERLLGVDHPETLGSRNSLANVYWSAGLVEEAVVLFESMVADRERMWGIDHPATLMLRNNLALAYRRAGRVEEAVALHERTLDDRERVLGVDHPDTLGSRHNLALAYESLRRVEDAIPLHESTVDDRERVLGVDHPDTLASRNNLADAYWSAGRVEEAVALHERTLDDRERVLGVDHPDTLASRNNLAGAYWSAGRAEEAIALFESTLAVCERILGVEHPTTAIVRANLERFERVDEA